MHIKAPHRLGAGPSAPPAPPGILGPRGGTQAAVANPAATPPAVAGGAAQAERPAPRTGRLVRIATAIGGVCLAGGLAVVAAWHLGAIQVLRVQAGALPIVYNIGLAFAVAGLGLIASGQRWRPVVLASAGFILALGLTSLLEVVLNRSLGVDQLLFHTTIAGAGGVPGRPAPDTSLALIALAIALLALEARPGWARTSVIAGAATLILALASFAASGYAFGFQRAYSWGHFNAMALPAVCLFQLAGAAVLLLMSSEPLRGPADRSAGAAVRPAQRPTPWTVRRVVASLTLLTLVPILLLTYVSIRLSSGALSQEARARLQTAATLEARAVLVRLQGQKTTVQSQLARPGVIAAVAAVTAHAAAGEAASLQSLLDATLKELDGAVSIGIVDPSGTLLSVTPASPSALGQNFSYRDWYRGSSQTGVAYVSEAVQSAAGTHPLVIAIAAPIRGPDGGVLGYASVGYSLIGIQEYIRSFGIGSVALMVTDQAGTILAAQHQPAGLVSAASQEPVRQALAGRSGVLAQPGPGGRSLVAYAPIEGVGWAVTATTPQATAIERVPPLAAAVTGISLVLVVVLVVALAFTADVWRRRERAERDLDIAMAELARSNDELEQFAYVASHDLSEPLRAISGPISFVARRYRGRLDPEADEFIAFAVDGCQRMQQLIDGLLAYSRVGRLETPLGPVDCNLVMNGVLASLGPAIVESGAIVQVGDLPVVTAEANQLGQVLRNLVSNAIKFVPTGRTPEVSVEANLVGDRWRFTVTDNGIGIAAEHRERIFGMFKRLHSREEYVGTGIGLALAKKIVERHGGSIGVEDGPGGVGSRFWFTLPARKGVAL